jgi:hypothetical protein
MKPRFVIVNINSGNMMMHEIDCRWLVGCCKKGSIVHPDRYQMMRVDHVSPNTRLCSYCQGV